MDQLGDITRRLRHLVGDTEYKRSQDMSAGDLLEDLVSRLAVLAHELEGRPGDEDDYLPIHEITDWDTLAGESWV